MKGLTIETVYDYSVGPGPRVKLTIDCNEFNPEHGWGNDFESCPELDELIQPYIDTVKALNSPNVSVVLNNYNIDDDDDITIDNEDLDTAADNYGFDLYWLYSYLEKFDIQSIWIYTEYDFVELLNIYYDIPFILSSCNRKAKIYFVCGVPDETATVIDIPGQVLDVFPVKPFYRQAFNQKIWEISDNIYRDVTNSIDPYYKIWFKNTIINN